MYPHKQFFLGFSYSSTVLAQITARNQRKKNNCQLIFIMRDAANQNPVAAACPVSVPMFQVFVIARRRRISATDPRSSSTATDGKTQLSPSTVWAQARARLTGRAWCWAGRPAPAPPPVSPGYRRSVSSPGSRQRSWTSSAARRGR